MGETAKLLKFVEYLYAHEPKFANLQEEKDFVKELIQLHRSLRDPTFDIPLENPRLQNLYFFPYGSAVLQRSPENWLCMLPVTIKNDLEEFFKKTMNTGLNIVYLQCADGKHVEFSLKIKECLYNSRTISIALPLPSTIEDLVRIPFLECLTLASPFDTTDAPLLRISGGVSGEICCVLFIV